MTLFRRQLRRVDMRSNRVTEVQVGNQPWGPAVGAGSLWVGHQSDREVWRLDRRTGETAAKVQISDAARGIGFGGGLVWVVSMPLVTDQAAETHRCDVQETLEPLVPGSKRLRTRHTIGGSRGWIGRSWQIAHAPQRVRPPSVLSWCTY